MLRSPTPEERAVLRQLARRSDVRALLTIAADWSVVLLAAAVSKTFLWPWLYPLAVILIARQMNALFELHHHAIHANLFTRKSWNSRLQFFYSLPLTTTIAADRDDHMDHHRTYTETDTLTWGTGYGLDLARRHDRRYMIWFLWVRPFLGPLQLSDLKEVLTSKRWLDPAYRNPVAVFWIFTIAVFGLLGRLDLLFWFWVVPRFTVFPILFFWDDMLGHYNCPRTGTREMRGLWFRLFGAHGTSFHNIHHQYPAIPWFNMETATRLVFDESEVDVAHGFVDGMRQLVGKSNEEWRMANGEL